MTAAAKKDIVRIEALLTFTQQNGITAGVEKAEREAAVITKPEKAKARADLLEQRGAAMLARPYFNRHRWLTA